MVSKEGDILKRVLHHYNQTFKMNFYFCLGWRQDRYRAFLKRRFDLRLPASSRRGHTIHLIHPDSNIPAIAIWVAKDSPIAILAHECLHAVNMTLLDRGVLPSFENDEVQAYLLEELMRKATGDGRP